MFKNYVQKKLERYVRKYFRKHPEVRLVVVAGSVGKTSTKMAIATVLSKQFRVRLDNGNHGTHLSTPLGILGIEYPAETHSISAWLRVFSAAKRRIKEPADVDIIIQELTARGIGSMAQYGSYLWPTISVVTAVTSERMETFGTIEQIAQEELMVANFSQLALINRDDIEGRFSGFLTNQAIDTYGTTSSAEYRFEINDFSLVKGYKGSFISLEASEPFDAQVHVIGEQSLRPVIAAVAVAQKLGMIPTTITQGISEIHPTPGHMNVLRGIKGSVIIDDTYSSTPIAATSALQTIYGLQVSQRVVIFGSMNHLGSESAVEHEKLGKLCDPNLLSWVITIGTEAEQYLAPAARLRGCQVKSFKSALEAGAFAHSVLGTGAVVLAKGSVDDIYAEEAVRILLHDTTEDRFLVRQESEWKTRKNHFFAEIID
ncbi:MAG: Mur ligase family protein [Candidatus Saccharimonadales bacterium]